MDVAVLVSGTGTILESLLGAGLPITVVIADRQCRALQVAADAGVEAVLVDRREFGGFGSSFERDRYTEALTAVMMKRGVDLVAMAGFGTVLGVAVHDAFPGRIVNTHPALLPLYPGWHAVRDALAAGATQSGCTVHVATLELDEGPVLAQEAVPVYSNDDEASLHERIKAVERWLYPEAIAKMLADMEGHDLAGRSAISAIEDAKEVG